MAGGMTLVSNTKAMILLRTWRLDHVEQHGSASRTKNFNNMVTSAFAKGIYYNMPWERDGDFEFTLRGFVSRGTVNLLKSTILQEGTSQKSWGASFNKTNERQNHVNFHPTVNRRNENEMDVRISNHLPSL